MSKENLKIIGIVAAFILLFPPVMAAFTVYVYFVIVIAEAFLQ